MSDTPKATAADAEVILKLYDLRRETEMRKARNWFVGEFFPQNWEEFHRVVLAFGTPENTYLRQVLSYWEMACTLVQQGALHADLFFASNHEAYATYSRIRPFLQQARSIMSPEFAVAMEQVLEATPEGKARVERMLEANKRWFAMRQEQRTQREAAQSV